MNLHKAERLLRRYDKLLRVRHSLTEPVILIERKTFVGRIGALMAGGEDYLPDSGYRREHGHVHVAAVHESVFDARVMLDSLKQADTWKWGESLADRIERQEIQQAATKRRNRESDMRYKAAQLFDSYVTKYKQRIYVPQEIH
jgi:hypothetical protein